MVLLAILVIGLIISHSIVLSRSYIKLSQPNEVPASGFSFCMPEGTGLADYAGREIRKEQLVYDGRAKAAGWQRTATRLTVSYVSGRRTDRSKRLAYSSSRRSWAKQ